MTAKTTIFYCLSYIQYNFSLNNNTLLTQQPNCLPIQVLLIQSSSALPRIISWIVFVLPNLKISVWDDYVLINVTLKTYYWTFQLLYTSLEALGVLILSIHWYSGSSFTTSSSTNPLMNWARYPSGTFGAKKVHALFY